MATFIQVRPYRQPADALEEQSLGPVLEFMRLMWAVNHRLDRASRRMQAAFGVTGPQRLVLRIVGTFPCLSAGDLAKTLHVHPSTLTGILQRLESRGLLRRLSDPDDARRVRLELTAKGRRLTVPAVGSVESSIKRVLAKWTDGELDATRRALTSIADGLEEPVAAEKGRAQRIARRVTLRP